MSRVISCCVYLLSFLAFLFLPSLLFANEVNVYSYRQSFLVKPLFDLFTKETGIKVNTIFASQGLVSRIKSEDKNSPADLLITSDFGRLADALEAEIARVVQDKQVEKNIPARLRDSQGRWFGLTQRARIIYAAKERVAPNEITSYADLADQKFEGRICMRKGTHDYNISLIASVIAHEGKERARQWLEGVKNNLAQKPQGNDRAQVKAIFNGICDISIGNSYYFGRMKADPNQRPWADSVRIIFPSAGNGVHMNVSGAMVMRYAPNAENAIKLLRFLSDQKAQEIYAEANYEYPVRKGVKLSKEVASWGEFREDTRKLEEIAALRKEAFLLVNRVNFDGPVK